ncbi:MAG: hypothetical protein U5K54_13375 [Cytophagales bacterium]|nr:hypothetical protein [Cytophagales bacterium]
MAIMVAMVAIMTPKINNGSGMISKKGIVHHPILFPDARVTMHPVQNNSKANIIFTNPQPILIFAFPQCPKSEYIASAPVVHKKTAPKIQKPPGYSTKADDTAYIGFNGF